MRPVIEDLVGTIVCVTILAALMIVSDAPTWAWTGLSLSTYYMLNNFNADRRARR